MIKTTTVFNILTLGTYTFVKDSRAIGAHRNAVMTPEEAKKYSGWFFQRAQVAGAAAPFGLPYPILCPVDLTEIDARTARPATAMPTVS